MALALVRYALAAILLIANIEYAALAQAVLPVPALTGRVVDHTATLSQAEIAALEARLASFERERGTQIIVLLVPSTAPEDMTSFANRVANDWKIGRKGIGDGLLLIVAKQDRKLRIEVAKTLEGAVPDLAARRIIDEAIAPHFKQGHYADGINSGLDQLFARVQGEALPAPTGTSKPSKGNGFDWMDMGIFLFFAIPVGATITQVLMGRVAGTLAIGAATGVLAFFITASLGVAIGAALLAMVWGLVTANPRAYGGGGSGGGIGSSFPTSSSGSGSDSGGFSSGGGGDFGGGGASGDW